MAATNFPNNPLVQLSVITHDVFPEQKREWIERFKETEPDNALANYLSAREHFQNKDQGAALQEFEQAVTKGKFNDHTLEKIQNAEELYMASGKSPVDAKMMGTTTVLLPHLAQLKGLAQSMVEVQKELMTAGNANSGQPVASWNYHLGQQLSSGEGTHFIIDQLVGMAIERMTISKLDPNQQYDFLGTTAQARIDQLMAEREEFKVLTSNSTELLENASDTDLLSYLDRMKIHGERAALEWLQERTKP